LQKKRLSQPFRWGYSLYYLFLAGATIAGEIELNRKNLAMTSEPCSSGSSETGGTGMSGVQTSLRTNCTTAALVNGTLGYYCDMKPSAARSWRKGGTAQVSILWVRLSPDNGMKMNYSHA
jgi:hypothetical protein